MKVSKDEDITTFTGKFILKATINQQSPPVKTKAKKMLKVIRLTPDKANVRSPIPIHLLFLL